MPMPLNNLTGKKIERLTVLRRYGVGSNPVKWECICDCGVKKIIAYKHLVDGTTFSCGCYRRELSKKPKKHGQSGRQFTNKRTSTYVTWEAIKQRCCNPNADGYENYGGRGITVCDRWHNSFEEFFNDMGERPKGHTIERIDNEKGYFKRNCRWATKRQQASNRRNTLLISYDREEKTLTEWAREYGMERGVLWHRLYNMKWPMNIALTKPVRKIKRSKN